MQMVTMVSGRVTISVLPLAEWVAMPPPGGLPDPGTEPWPPALQTDYLLFEPPGKPKIYITMCKIDS